MLVAVDQRIVTAIEERRLIRFVYDGLSRTAEPHDYGVRNGTVQLLVYQIAGDSRSGGLPQWRCVKLAGVSALELLDEKFAGSREAGQHGDWERLFARVSAPE